jgi:ABC-type amino acid transport substrate-binding protein
MEFQDNRIRFGLFPSFFYTKDAGTGALTGFGIELARSLAASLERDFLLIEYAAPPDVVRALKAGDCDVGLLGIDPGRGTDVDFTSPYLRADFTFLVPANSGIERIEDIDLPPRLVPAVSLDCLLSGE